MYWERDIDIAVQHYDGVPDEITPRHVRWVVHCVGMRMHVNWLSVRIRECVYV